MDGRQKVLLIGANGQIGQAVAASALKHFEVYCLISSYPKFGINSIYVKFTEGNALVDSELESALEGMDIVISCFGDKNQENKTAITDYTAKLLSALHKKGINRLISVNSSGVLLHKPSNDSFWKCQQYPQELKSRAQDHEKAVKLIQSSNLAYTVVCPHVIEKQPYEGECVYKRDLDANLNSVTPLGKLAETIVEVAKNNSDINQVYTVVAAV